MSALYSEGKNIIITDIVMCFSGVSNQLKYSEEFIPKKNCQFDIFKILCSNVFLEIPLEVHFAGMIPYIFQPVLYPVVIYRQTEMRGISFKTPLYIESLHSWGVKRDNDPLIVVIGRSIMEIHE